MLHLRLKFNGIWFGLQVLLVYMCTAQNSTVDWNGVFLRRKFMLMQVRDFHVSLFINVSNLYNYICMALILANGWMRGPRTNNTGIEVRTHTHIQASKQTNSNRARRCESTYTACVCLYVFMYFIYINPIYKVNSFRYKHVKQQWQKYTQTNTQYKKLTNLFQCTLIWIHLIILPAPLFAFSFFSFLPKSIHPLPFVCWFPFAFRKKFHHHFDKQTLAEEFPTSANQLRMLLYWGQKDVWHFADPIIRIVHFWANKRQKRNKLFALHFNFMCSVRLLFQVSMKFDSIRAEPTQKVPTTTKENKRK